MRDVEGKTGLGRWGVDRRNDVAASMACIVGISTDIEAKAALHPKGAFEVPTHPAWISEYLFSSMSYF
jgi:hypothetical protein